MIYPRKWSIRRPGFLIPVFFLSCLQAYGQNHWLDAGSAGLGACFVTRSGQASVGLNQAGLGRREKNAVSLHHIRPFITSDLDIASLSAQLALKQGGAGLSLSTMGISGMRQTSAWISYGLMLHPRLFAGAGIHLGNTSLAKEANYQMEAGFALGLQFSISDELILGAHLSNPAVWSSNSGTISGSSMMISSGISYLFYETARYYTEFHVRYNRPVQWCNGFEIKIKERLQLLLGLKNQPWCLSAGISLNYQKVGICLSGTYCMDTGCTPYTSLSYEW